MRFLFLRYSHLHFLFVVSLFVVMAIGLTNSATAQERSNSVSRSTESEKPLATLKETRADIKAFSKRLDNSNDQAERNDAIVDLATVYLRVVGDRRFGVSERLQGFRGQIAARLKTEQKLIQRTARKVEKEAERQRRKEARLRQSKHQDQKESGSQPGTENENPDFDSRFQSAVVDRQWRLLAHSIGATGPSMYHSSGMHGTSGHFNRGHMAGIPDDNGDELVDLIHAILHPDFWQIAGGAGTLHYYQPLRILVVRATTEVHEDLEDFLERLR